MVEPAEGELVVSMAERSLTMDPADHYAISSTSVLRHIFDTLVDVTSESEFVAGLAESWEVIDDTTWQFDLRQGVEFHDGTPLDAEAVVATLERVRDNEELIKAFVFQNIETVEAESEYEVIVTTTTPFAALPGHLSMLGVMPAYAADDETAFFDEPVGTGPFRFVSWVRGEEIELEANDNYWQEDIPHVQHLTVRFIPELSTRVSGLRSGEIHIIDRVTPDMVETIEETDGVHVLEVPAVETSQWVFQMQREPVSDIRLRQAISLGIDREAIINEFMLGYAVPAVCPVPPPLIGHVDLGIKPYDPEAAREIIQDAGYEGVTLDFVLMRGVYPMQLEIVQAVQAMLGEVGIDINIRDMEIAAARDARSAGDFDLFYSGWAHMPHDPDWYFGQWFTVDGSAGLNRYDNPEVEQLIMDARVPDPEQRQQAYEELQRILWEEEEPAIWPFYSVALYGVSDQVQNYEPRPDYYVLSSEVSLG
jgi:peptide/nickel transport system substrate-binding protein